MSVPPAPPPGREPPPTDVHGAPTRVAPRAYAEPAVYEDPAAAAIRWQRALDSVRTGVALVAILAVAALAVGIWALVRAQDNRSSAGNRSGLATQADVAALNGRINHLAGAINAARGAAGAGAGSAAALSGRVATLQNEVKALQSANLSQQIGTLSGRVQTLQSQVAQLKAAQNQSGQTTTTTTQTQTTPGG
jgi:outer membrane murein-binding lipoprotein Lpp